MVDYKLSDELKDLCVKEQLITLYLITYMSTLMRGSQGQVRKLENWPNDKDRGIRKLLKTYGQDEERPTVRHMFQLDRRAITYQIVFRMHSYGEKCLSPLCIGGEEQSVTSKLGLPKPGLVEGRYVNIILLDTCYRNLLRSDLVLDTKLL